MIKAHDSSFKAEALKYLSGHDPSLYQVINKANVHIFNDYIVNMVDSLTISSTAVDIFLRSHYNKNVSNINTRSLYHNIKKAYCSGITYNV